MANARAASFEWIEATDGELARVARSSGALRVALGRGLEALARSDGHHELGFSSVEAYALERCERSARWVQESRVLARRLDELGGVRAAVSAGRIGFSAAQVIAKVATPDDQEAWVAEAERSTVRVLRRMVKARLAAERESANAEGTGDGPSAIAADDRVTLAVPVDREDAWLFECARMIAGLLGDATQEGTMEALLGEGVTALLPAIRREDRAEFEDVPDDGAQRRWEDELARWRDEAEARCEGHFSAGGAVEMPAGANDWEPAFEGCATNLDAELRSVASSLAKRDVEVGRLAEAFWGADGWRRLGYATETQYARERLGTSLSSVKAKRRLARRLEEMPRLAEAVANGEVGYEAARLVASVATPGTIEAWVLRAPERTVKCLREEVDAAAILDRLGSGQPAGPPSEETMKELAALESAVVSGRGFQGEAVQMSAELAERCAEFDRAHVPRAARAGGRVTLRFRVCSGLRRYYRWLERLFLRHRPTRGSFLRFLCLSLVESWKHALGSKAAYADIYARDRYRCSNPVCSRRDVTPHHLVFRSAGGDDSPENVASLCSWCHLEGVHLGRIDAKGPAGAITWTVGREAHTVVTGTRRERYRVAC